LADQSHCLPLSDLDDEVGAVIPETLFTVWYNLFLKPCVHPGENLLVHGGSGGIGTMAIVLGKHFGVNCYVTAGSNERAQRCLAVGARGAVNYKEADFVEAWSGIPMHAILDSLGGDYFEKNLALLATEGTLVQINCSRGRYAKLDLLSLMKHRFHLTGSTLRARDVATKKTIRDSILNEIWPQFLSGKISPVIEQVYRPDEVIQAHQDLEQGKVFGKILIKWK
jgi:NADPH2:quinone reductase